MPAENIQYSFRMPFSCMASQTQHGYVAGDAGELSIFPRRPQRTVTTKLANWCLKKCECRLTIRPDKRTASASAPLAAAPHTSILSPVPSCKAHAVKIIVGGCASCAHRGRPTGATRRYRLQITAKHH